MEEFLPTLILLRRELQLLTKVVAQMNKTHEQRLQEAWVKKAQATKILGISPRTLDRLLSSGKLPFSKINGLVFIRTSAIEKLLDDPLESRSAGTPSPLKTTNNDE